MLTGENKKYMSFDIYLKKTDQTEAEHCEEKLTPFLRESNATSWNQ